MAVHPSRRSAQSVLLLVSVVWVSGCGSALPYPTTAAPANSGTVTILVHDGIGAALANVPVQITEPNTVGGFFMVGANTDAAGMKTFQGVPAGQRPVQITPPSGYLAGPEGLIQNANVVSNKTTTITFALARQ